MKFESTNNLCLEISDLIEGYAIGVLDEREMLRVAESLASCPEQQEQLREYEETVGMLGLTVAPISPPDALWDRLNRSTVGEPLPKPIPIRSRLAGKLVVPRWMAAAVAAAIVLLFVSSLGLGIALKQERNDNSATAFDSTMATYLTSGGQVVPLASLQTPQQLGWAGRGSLLMAPNMPPVLVVDKCVPSSSHYAYFVWLQSGDHRTPMGNIVIDKNGQGMMTLDGVSSLAGYDIVGVTIKTSNDAGQEWTYDVMTGSPRQAN
jgi:hypothetical protein